MLPAAVCANKGVPQEKYSEIQLYVGSVVHKLLCIFETRKSPYSNGMHTVVDKLPDPVCTLA